MQALQCEKCPYLEFFWSLFFDIPGEYGDLQSNLSVFSPNAGKYGPEIRTVFTENSEYGYFLRILSILMQQSYF